MAERNQNKSNIRLWLDQDGNKLSDAQLREVSASWSTSQWEDYLESIETPLQEVLLSNFERVSLKQGAVESLEAYGSEEENLETNSLLSYPVIRKVLQTLTHRQRNIIELCILEDLPVSEAAKILRITPKSASKILSRALEYLRSILDPKIASKNSLSSSAETEVSP